MNQAKSLGDKWYDFGDRHPKAAITIRAVLSLAGVGLAGAMFLAPDTDNSDTAPTTTVDFDTSVVYTDGARELRIGNVTFRSVCDGNDLIETIETGTGSSVEQQGGAGGTNTSESSLTTGSRQIDYLPACADGQLTPEDYSEVVQAETNHPTAN